MAYNSERRAYECERCGPGNSRFKYYESYCKVDYNTGNVYCLVHPETFIGTLEEKANAKEKIC